MIVKHRKNPTLIKATDRICTNNISETTEMLNDVYERA